MYDFERLEVFEALVEKIELLLEEARAGERNPVISVKVPDDLLDDVIDFTEAQFDCVTKKSRKVKNYTYVLFRIGA